MDKETIIRVLFGCARIPRKLPNMRGFASYPGRSMVRDMFRAENGPGPTSDQISSAMQSCGCTSGQVCATQIAPGYDGQTGGPKRIVTFGVWDGKGGPPTLTKYSPSTAQTFSPNQSAIPDVEFVTITKIALGGSKGDVLVQFTSPKKFIGLASCASAHNGDALYFHFNPCGKQYTGNQIDPDGTENWIPFPKRALGSTQQMPWLKMCSGISQFFVDIGQDAGGANYNLTFVGSNSLELVQGVS